MLTVYMSIPLVWFILLWERKEQMNPWISNAEKSLYLRNSDPSLKPFHFLFSVYRIEFFWFEVVEMLRRVTFVGFLPLLSSDTSRRAACGVVGSLITLAISREACPFVRPSTNFLLVLAQYALLGTYATALAIDTELGKNIDPLVFGVLLAVINLLVLATVGLLGFRQYSAAGQYHRVLTDAEVHLLDACMADIGGGSLLERAHGGGLQMSDMEVNGESTGISKTEFSAIAETLKQCLVSPQDVKMTKRIGMGAYGEVFLGTCMLQPVAIKTMHHVNEVTVPMFRQEILLTASLRHPNITGFVGACWCRELTCLILEMVPGGTLSDFLEVQNKELRWEEHLLALAVDIARGMKYLHAREWHDEVTGKLERCVMHRDLKCDNVLITAYTTAKVSDFGTSRSMGDEPLARTVVGTPFFAAPEVMRGDAYTELVDVFSFGMILANMAVRNIPRYFGEVWCSQNPGASQETGDPNSGFFRQVMFAIWKDGWRAVTDEQPLPETPRSLSELVVRCCDHEPSGRPSFDEIFEQLTGPCAADVSEYSSSYVPATPTQPTGATTQGSVGGLALSKAKNDFRSMEGHVSASFVYRSNANPLVAPTARPRVASRLTASVTVPEARNEV